MRLLPPQRLRPHYFEKVERQLEEYFRSFVFAPLELILAEATTQADGIFGNTAPTPNPTLVAALRRGTIQYAGEVISGELDAKLSGALRGIGAQFDGRTGEYRLPQALAPAWFKIEAAAAQARAENVHKALERQLNAMQERLETGMGPVPVDPSVPIEAIEDGFESAAAAIGITKRIPAGARAAMEARYLADVRPYVAEATSEYIDGLHKAVADNAARGYRYETIVEDIQHYVGVSERKARFLARHETSLFMSGYRRERFTAAGVLDYFWSTSHDIRVRPYADAQKLKKYGDHRVLDKQRFSYEHKAPAQYMSRKLPSNPGEDYGCRCADLAALK